MRRSGHPWVVLLAIAGVTRALPAPVWAQANVAIELDWSAPEGCPAAAEVRAEIEQLLGGSLDERARIDLRVRAAVERRELWLVTLDTRTGATEGHRTLKSATCQGLASATALIVALMIDPDAVAAQANKAKESRRAVPKQPEASAAVSAEPVPPPPPRPRSTFGIAGLGAVGHLGVLPSADVGLAAHLGFARRSWRLELRGAYGPREVGSDSLSEARGAYGKFRFWAASLAACWTVAGAVARFGPCADVEVGGVEGEGVRATQTTSATTLWLGLGGGAVLVIEATPWLHFPVHADAIVPLRRPNYVFNNVEQPIFRPWPVGARLGLAAEARF